MSLSQARTVSTTSIRTEARLAGSPLEAICGCFGYSIFVQMLRNPRNSWLAKPAICGPFAPRPAPLLTATTCSLVRHLLRSSGISSNRCLIQGVDIEQYRSDQYPPARNRRGSKNQLLKCIKPTKARRHPVHSRGRLFPSRPSRRPGSRPLTYQSSAQLAPSYPPTLHVGLSPCSASSHIHLADLPHAVGEPLPWT